MSYKVVVVKAVSSADEPASSAACAAKALAEAGHDVSELEATPALAGELREMRPDVIFNALQGAEGEDGSVQTLADLLGIPVIGSTARACREAWDKSSLASAFSRYYGGIAGDAVAPNGFVLSKTASQTFGASGVVDLVEDQLPAGYPIAIKPVHGGFAQGISKAATPEEAAAALEEVFASCDEALVEEWVDGVHMAVAVLGSGHDSYALPPVEYVAGGADGLECFAPVRLESLSHDEASAQAIRSEVERAASDAHRACAARDLSRVDVVWDGARVRVLEVDLNPSVEEGSPFCRSCEVAGLSLSALLNELCEQAVEER